MRVSYIDLSETRLLECILPIIKSADYLDYLVWEVDQDLVIYVSLDLNQSHQFAFKVGLLSD